MNLFAEFSELIGSILRRIVAQCRLPENVDLQRFAFEPPRAAHGDLSTNAAMVYAKEARPHFANPRQLAVEIAAALADNPDVAEAEVAGPGFLNIRMTPTVFARVLRAANDIKPDVSRTFKVPDDPAFVEKFWDVTGLYLNPPEKGLLPCCDEKSQCQALERTQPGLPLGGGHIKTRTHDYTRASTLVVIKTHFPPARQHPWAA